MNIEHSMARKVIGGYLNASEHASKEDLALIHTKPLDESIFELQTHKMIVRAINNVKQSGAEVCDLNVLAFLERHGIPRNIQEANEITAVISEYAITPKSFNDYVKHLRLQRANKVAI